MIRGFIRSLYLKKGHGACYYVCVKASLRYLLIANYINLLGFAMFSPLYALFPLRIGAQAFETGAAWATYTAIAGILIIIFGKMEDSFRKKHELIVVGYFWLALGALAFLLAKSPLSLFVVLGFNAIGAGILVPAWKAAYTHLKTRVKKRANGRSLTAAVCSARQWLRWLADTWSSATAFTSSLYRCL